MEKLRPIAALGVTPIVEASYPEPFKARMGSFQCRLLGDAFGLTQFGANLEILAPGAQSALRHWHSLSDEFVYVLEGELVLHTDDGETPISAQLSAEISKWPCGSEIIHGLWLRQKEQVHSRSELSSGRFERRRRTSMLPQ